MPRPRSARTAAACRPDNDRPGALGRTRVKRVERRATYLSEPATEVNVLDRFVPTAVTAVMMTRAISEAIRAYSIAVAPSSLAKKRVIDFISGFHQPKERGDHGGGRVNSS